MLAALERSQPSSEGQLLLLEALSACAFGHRRLTRRAILDIRASKGGLYSCLCCLLHVEASGSLSVSSPPNATARACTQLAGFSAHRRSTAHQLPQPAERRLGVSPERRPVRPCPAGGEQEGSPRANSCGLPTQHTGGSGGCQLLKASRLPGSGPLWWARI